MMLGTLRSLAQDDPRPWYIQARDWIADSAVVNAATSGRDYALEEARQAIASLYDTGMEFQRTLGELLSLEGHASQSPELSAQYRALVSRGHTVNDVIRNAVRSVQSIAGWVRENMGVDLDAPPTPMLSGLGFVQVIPLAIIGGVLAATALAAAWIVDARSGIDKIHALQRLVEGVPMEERAGVIEDALKQSGGLTATISSAQNLLIVGAIIAAGIFFAPQLKRLVSRGSR
jgi:hypothetical protein